LHSPPISIAVAFRGQANPILVQPVFLGTGYRNLAEKEESGVTGTGIGSSEV
jgi:hypothetical protein